MVAFASPQSVDISARVLPTTGASADNVWIPSNSILSSAIGSMSKAPGVFRRRSIPLAISISGEMITSMGRCSAAYSPVSCCAR